MGVCSHWPGKLVGSKTQGYFRPRYVYEGSGQGSVGTAPPPASSSLTAGGT